MSAGAKNVWVIVIECVCAFVSLMFSTFCFMIHGTHTIGHQ